MLNALILKYSPCVISDNKSLAHITISVNEIF